MEIVLPLFVILVLAMTTIGLWAYVRLEQHKIKYGNPVEIAELRIEMAEYRKIINMLDQEALKALEKRVTELAGQMRDAQVMRITR
jgi:hypothetical protein